MVARNLLNAIGEEVLNSITVIDAQRLPGQNLGKPRLMKIAFESVEKNQYVECYKTSLSNTVHMVKYTFAAASPTLNACWS